ncbi:MAG: GIY-YIG nuclease family protein [Candidatus Magasanikbacteria bacterium]|nr:GIY-YIG nuclease family protein [Candidatus Magasanikbacteria bacterium]
MKLVIEIKQFPDGPGIYLFYDIKKELIYVGKATSLRNRVGSYFRGTRTSRPIEQMIHEVVDIKIKQTDSVLEALILEGSYIKKYQPKYNIDWKDDKSWNYIGITTDLYPRVITLRQHELSGLDEKQIKQNISQRLTSLWLGQIKQLYGPYPGMKTKETMRLLQKLFFISTCKPNSKRECLYQQMGQCLGVCTGEISPTDYRQKVVRPLTMFLRGNKKGVIKDLEQKMKEASKMHEFEEAARLRNQIEGLWRIHDIALLNNSFFDDFVDVYNENGRDRSRPVRTDFVVQRIEGYDISNFGITGKVGSMVVFDSFGPVKSQYRKFKIKTVEGQSDVDCLSEVLERRLRHVNIALVGTGRDLSPTSNAKKDPWPLPDIFLIDGGKPQVNRAKQVLKKYNIGIPIVGIAKGPDRKKNEFIFRSMQKEFVLWVHTHQNLLIRVRDEAHRFAITYQKKLRKIK